MGNCCAVESSMDQWAGEDWGSYSSKHKCKNMGSSKVFDEVHGLSFGNVEKERLLGSLRASSDVDGKVKIKISKKELAELLGGTEKKQVVAGSHASAEQVLVRLINARYHVVNEHHDAHHRSWKPVLQRIPEVN